MREENVLHSGWELYLLLDLSGLGIVSVTLINRWKTTVGTISIRNQFTSLGWSLEFIYTVLKLNNECSHCVGLRLGT